MKKMLLAASLAFAASAAQADLTIGNFTLTSGNGAPFTQSFQSNVSITPSDGGWGPIANAPEATYTEGNYGMLTVDAATTVVYTFLGKVAAFDNNIEGAWVGGSRMNDSTVGSTRAVEVEAGRLEFGFVSNRYGESADYGVIQNGMDNTVDTGIMYFDATAFNEFNDTNFAFLIGYNDPANVNADYDDYVVGVQAVPVPAALPLMASALGMFGIARRRKSA